MKQLKLTPEQMKEAVDRASENVKTWPRWDDQKGKPMSECTSCRKHISEIDVDDLGAVLCPKCWGRISELDEELAVIDQEITNEDDANLTFDARAVKYKRKAFLAENLVVALEFKNSMLEDVNAQIESDSEKFRLTKELVPMEEVINYQRRIAELDDCVEWLRAQHKSNCDTSRYFSRRMFKLEAALKIAMDGWKRWSASMIIIGKGTATKEEVDLYDTCMATLENRNED